MNPILERIASGEWIARKTDFNDDLVTIAHCGDWRVGVQTGIKGGNYRDWDGGSDEVHARLIAAAPDLLAALALLHDNLAEYQRINHLGGYNNHDMVMARAAIAKATVIRP